ncbi:hypothetical protein MTR67_018279 [Solanum verrucosum]|uniref:Uncharacterized protein n=1 Tax=Solanum verrucosum TaxID=315347 RepID=A0AAF0TMJ6_SOLVR|nr:hypothetical protein MTR67_018279 [Solanum verrucosum]
MRLISFTRE